MAPCVPDGSGPHVRDELESKPASPFSAPLLFGLTVFASPDFSHPVHLELGLACAHCHAGAETSRQAGDQIFPQPAVCLSCHAGGESTPRRPGPAPLDGCGAELPVRPCLPRSAGRPRSGPGGRHRRRQVFRIILRSVPCWTGPAAARPATGDSTPERPLPFPSCPTAWSATRRSTTPSVAATATWRGANLRPEDHTQEFADLHGTGRIQLDKASCLPCHGTNFECRGCH